MKKIQYEEPLTDLLVIRFEENFVNTGGAGGDDTIIDDDDDY